MQSPPRYRRFEEIPDVIARLVPDAVTASVILTFTIVGLALALGNPVTRILDAYHQGLWMLLQFTMQMTLRTRPVHACGCPCRRLILVRQCER